MNSFNQSTIWLTESPLAPYIEAYKKYFIQESYSSKTIKSYFHCIAHFAHWVTQSNLDILHINEATIEEFINGHLLECTCTNPHLSVRIMHAALIHLIRILNDNGITTSSCRKVTPTDEELQAYDNYMNHVKGLAQKTRRQYLRITERLLSETPVIISAIKPEDVRQFINRQKKRYSTSGNFSVLITALRGYFRYRTTCGDQFNHLIGVANYPANWQLSSLPKTLNNEEVECLLETLDNNRASDRKTKAIVHCALDLGLL